MARGQGARGDGVVRWLLPASVLHATFAVLAAALSSSAEHTISRSWATQPALERATSRSRAGEPASNVELTLLREPEWPAAFSAAPATAIDVAPPANDPGLARAAATHTRASSASAEASLVASATSLDISNGVPPAISERESPAIEPTRAGTPTLSLAQLGIGANPFLGVAIEPLTKQQQADARLQAALHPPSVDRQRNLGPEGPVVKAARHLVSGEETLLETSAVFDVRVDSAGRVASIHVLEASSQIKVWQLIAARLTQALSSAKLRTTGAEQGCGMKLRLASSVQLPSGAAPGMRFGVLGQQVAGSGGPASTSLELSPTSKLDIKEPIDSVGRHLDQPIQFEVMLLKLRADPTDLGATARRVVEVAVLSIEAPATP